MTGPRPSRSRAFAALAFGLAALLGLLSLGAGAFHQHVGEAGAAQFDCRACAWTHAAASALGQAPPAIAPVPAATLAWTVAAFHVPSVTSTRQITRGPPSSSL